MSPRASLSIRAASVHVCSRPPGEPPRAATAGACRRPRAVSMPLRLRRRRRGASGPRVAESHARGGAEHRAVGPAGPGSRSRRPADPQTAGGRRRGGGIHSALGKGRAWGASPVDAVWPLAAGLCGARPSRGSTRTSSRTSTRAAMGVAAGARPTLLIAMVSSVFYQNRISPSDQI